MEAAAACSCYPDGGLSQALRLLCPPEPPACNSNLCTGLEQTERMCFLALIQGQPHIHAIAGVLSKSLLAMFPHVSSRPACMERLRQSKLGGLGNGPCKLFMRASLQTQSSRGAFFTYLPTRYLQQILGPDGTAFCFQPLRAGDQAVRLCL